MKKKTTQRDSFHEREVVASATECTGLIPGMSDADPDAELNQALLYAIHAPKKRDGKREETCAEETENRAGEKSGR